MKIDRLNPCYAAFHADAVERLSRLPDSLLNVRWLGEYYQQIAYEVLGRVLNKDEIDSYDTRERFERDLIEQTGMDTLGVAVPKWTRDWGDRKRVVVRLRLDSPCWGLIIGLSLLHTSGQLVGLTPDEKRQVVAHEAVETLSRALRYQTRTALAQSDIVRGDKFWEDPDMSHLRPATVQQFMCDTMQSMVFVVRNPERCFGTTTVAGVMKLWRHQRESRILEILPEFAAGAELGGGAGFCIRTSMNDWEAAVWREFLSQDVVDVPTWLQEAHRKAGVALSLFPTEQWVVHRVGLESQSLRRVQE